MQSRRSPKGSPSQNFISLKIFTNYQLCVKMLCCPKKIMFMVLLDFVLNNDCSTNAKRGKILPFREVPIIDNSSHVSSVNIKLLIKRKLNLSYDIQMYFSSFKLVGPIVLALMVFLCIQFLSSLHHAKIKTHFTVILQLRLWTGLLFCKHHYLCMME